VSTAKGRRKNRGRSAAYKSSRIKSGSNGYFHIDTGNVVSKEKKEGLEDV